MGSKGFGRIGLRILQNNKALKPGAALDSVTVSLRILQNNKALKPLRRNTLTIRSLRILQNNKALKLKSPP